MNQIRLEEVIETFRSVWWFENRLVTDGAYAFLGWYTTLSTVYNIFGLTLYTPKFVKLFIEFISYFALAAFLLKYLSPKVAWMPLLLIGLSPTFMYFNSLQLSMGLEVSYFFIVLYLISKLNFKSKFDLYLKQPFIWAVAMFAWLTYFSFPFFLILLGAYYLYSMKSQIKKINTGYLAKNLLISLTGFLIPLISLFFYIENRELLIYDPLFGKGLFRSFATVDLSKETLGDNVYRISSDLFLLQAVITLSRRKLSFQTFYR